MELQFQKQEVSCLQNTLCQVQNLEQTQELRVPEGMPGIGRILGCWGQVLIRGKQWQHEAVRVSGGTLVWLLYDAEEGTTPQKLETWIPFQMDWDIPANVPDGQIQVKPLLRFADARSVSAGKVLIRVGLAVLAQAWTSQTAELFRPESVPSDVELLHESIPVRLPKEAGEKAFDLEDQLTVPASVPRPEKLLYYRLTPEVTDSKVLSNKVVFRGNGNLHVLYVSEDGQLHTWDFEVPFSQYAELEGSHSTDAQSNVTLATTALELETDEEGTFHLKAGLTGQYLVEDRDTVEIVRDAWSPVRQVEVRMEELELPVVLDSRRERISAEEKINWDGDLLADAVVLADFPRQRREGDQVVLEQPGLVQLLGYDGEGRIQGMLQHLRGQHCLKMDQTAGLQAVPQEGELQTGIAGDHVSVQWEVPVQLRTMAGQGIPMVTALELGEKKEPDPARPSLILRRAGGDRLWDIAKESGSTVAAIQEANNLTGQPDPGKLLLIPVI